MDIDNRIPVISEENPTFSFWCGEREQVKIEFIKVIGRGGSCIAYKCKRIEGDETIECVVKEYYPAETSLEVEYVRTAPGQPLKIVSALDGAAGQQAIERELQRQEENLSRELQTNRDLFYREGSSRGNSPYFYKADFIRKFGDSSYMILNTSEGRTLHTALRDSPGKRLDWKTSLSYTRKLLEIIRWIEERGYIHGDISLSNVWIAGNRENEYLLLLDLGSAFRKSDYTLDDIALEQASDEQILDLAKKIAHNESLGSSHENIRSDAIFSLWNAKLAFCNAQNIRRAKDLINAIAQIDVRTDIYSAFKLFFRMVTGIPYSWEVSKNRISQLLGDQAGIVLIEQLLRMMRRNEDMAYSSVSQALNALDEIERLVTGSCSPLVLLEKIGNQLDQNKYEEELFAPVVIE